MATISFNCDHCRQDRIEDVRQAAFILDDAPQNKPTKERSVLAVNCVCGGVHTVAIADISKEGLLKIEEWIEWDLVKVYERVVSPWPELPAINHDDLLNFHNAINGQEVSI